MCGRYALTTPADVLAAVFRLASMPAIEPRYNIAPTQDAPVIRVDRSGERVCGLMRWGLVPWWSKDPGAGAKAINARSETAANLPSFRESFRRRRCLVPADGFYEWLPVAGRKQPYFVGRADRRVLAYAGLWERWKSPEGDRLETYTILTTDACPRLAEIHGRMPVILDDDEWAGWLDPSVEDPAEVRQYLDAFPEDQIDIHAVSLRVNDVANDDATLLDPVKPIEEEPTLF